MPRRATHTTTNDEKTSQRQIRVEKPNVLQKVKTFISDPRTRIISAVVLLATALLLLVACISYFFAGTSDQSVLQMSSPDRREHRDEIQNLLGLPGASVAEFLLNGAFGWMAFVLIGMLIIYGLRLFHVGHTHPLRILLCGTFGVLWGDVLLGFVQQMVSRGTFCWGGAFGQWLATWLNSYIQPTGMIIVLAVTLVIFLIITEKNFIPNMKRFGLWFAGLFKRKPKTEEPTKGTLPDEPQEIVLPEDPKEDEQPIDIEIHIDDLDHTPAEAPAGDDITLTIEPTQEEEMHTESAPEEPKAEEPEDGKTTIDINETQPVELVDASPEDVLAKLGPYDPRKDLEYYKFPSLDLLKVYDNETGTIINKDEQNANAKRIVETLRNFGIEIDSIKATIGPTVTLYEIVPKAGIKISKIQSLENDIMMSLAATGIRMIAPMPGKGTVGIEVPNEKPQTVSMHSVIASKRFQEEQKMRLPVAIGRTITNEVFMFDLAKTPHLLVAGATGQGKSVAINAILTSLLYKKHPAELK